ncbi:Zinc finger Ran-binding domain-containing protein 3 [Tupaia chinensis]|uniref:Zinc finger Ran-binding domain-containing protein 3 n=1 Tax=Tupaia chinensis TaxID=246437 RepID=L8Y1J2_TUPCH|nr:Zinc finger Ran-binding domain-containing protein 3 [Tupaia chinensis]
MLQACTEAVIENKTRYIRIDGSVPSSERIHLVNQFQKDPDTRVAILSIQAAGQGLTFTAASHVVFAELYWDPGHIKQAEDRAHRIGQCSSVNIHYLIANGTLDTLMWGMLNRKAQVTGSTLNGRKEKIQAEEDDKEKWDFLQFAEAWTPNDNSEELRKEVLFTHFEKEKQHDIRSFFLPKPIKRQLVTSCDESRTFQEKNTLMASDPRKISASDVAYESDFEPEVKRLKLVTTDDPCNPLEEKLSCPRQSKAPLTDGVYEASSQPDAPALPGKGWQCGFCTYLNHSMLPCCEMCENPRVSADNLNHIQNKNRNEKDDSEKDTSQNAQTSSACEKQVLAQSEPDPLAESEKETPEIEREDGLTPQPSNEILKSSDALPVYDTLMFCASRNTDRIHLFSKILRFVREWSSLTAMKQRVIRKSGHLFCSPIIALEEIAKQQTKQNSTKRYITKEDVAVASMDKVKNDGGHVRLITKESRRWDPSTNINMIAQCRTNSSRSVLKIADLVFLLQLNEMIRNPAEGHFWQVDHIKPVYGGGGQCSLDNLQTLCTICHKEVSAAPREL